MWTIEYHSSKKSSILAQALEVLNAGGTVVYPTETAYALGGDFYSPGAYKAIFEIKYRAGLKALPVIVPSVSYAQTLVRFTPRASELAARYWPGPLTLVLPFVYRKHFPHHEDDYLAIRVSSHPLASSLAHVFGRPLISTSANLSGLSPCYGAYEVIEQLSKGAVKPDLVIDAGEIPVVAPSTLVKCDERGVVVLREGPIHIDV